MARSRATQTARGEIYVARETFTTLFDGVPMTVHLGEAVREGHPILKGRESLFRPLQVRFETAPQPVMEQATAAPGEARGDDA